MIQTILIPFDTSARAGLAMNYAAAIANATGGRLILYAVIPDEGLRNYAESQLARAAEQIEPAVVDVTTRVECRDGVSSAIVETARAGGADLIAMATSAWSDLDRWLRGSVADEVLRQSDVPVLIVPAQAGETVIGTRQGIGLERLHAITVGPVWPAADEQSPRILVTLDGSDLALQALGPARALAGALHAELLLLRVVERPFSRATQQPSEAEEYLEAVAATVPAGEGLVKTLTVVGDPPAAIADTASTQGAHLIVMATRGRGGLARQFLGSVATSTLQQANIPVLLVRPATADG